MLKESQSWPALLIFSMETGAPSANIGLTSINFSMCSFICTMAAKKDECFSFFFSDSNSTFLVIRSLSFPGHFLYTVFIIRLSMTSSSAAPTFSIVFHSKNPLLPVPFPFCHQTSSINCSFILNNRLQNCGSCVSKVKFEAIF